MWPFARKKKPDIADRIDSLQVDRLWLASNLGMNLNHRACWKYTKLIRNLLYDMGDEDRRFLADEGPEYPLENTRWKK